MEIRQQMAALKTGRAELRRFGLWVGGVLVLWGGWLWHREAVWHGWVWGPGLMLVLLGGLVPGCLRGVYRAWMAVGIALGAVVGTVLLTLFYYLMVSPLGILARLTGKDFLELKREPKADSYWKERASGAKSREDYERQF